jgi:fructoselysine transporter
MENKENRSGLIRALGLWEATSINMIDMVGIGPFVVIPFVVGTMHGSYSILAWVLGALLAVLDGFVWSELGAAMPEAGGSYIFLKTIYGERKWGRLMSFLYTWQTVIQAPLVIASGSIGFSQYLTYLLPLTPVQQKLVSGGLVLLLVALLYRRINSVGKISLFLWAGVIGTMAWLIFGGITHFDVHFAINNRDQHFELFSVLFFAALGQASVKTVYSYLGYYNVCHLGGEIIRPERNIPRSIFLSIAGIAVLYLLMQTCILGVLPWEEIKDSPFVVSTFFENLYGKAAAQVATALVLWIAGASLFAVMLGYSRVPYAAAVDGQFFPVFAKLHPKRNFPHVSLLVLGGVAFVFSLLFKLKDVITAIIVMRILVQFIGQSAGIMFLRKSGRIHLPFKMWLYPLPAVLGILVWLFIFFSSGWYFILAALGIIAAGVIIFLARSRTERSWPFERTS